MEITIKYKLSIRILFSKQTTLNQLEKTEGLSDCLNYTIIYIYQYIYPHVNKKDGDASLNQNHFTSMKDHALQNIHFLFLRISVVFFELNIFKGVLMVGYQYPQYNIKVFRFFFYQRIVYCRGWKPIYSIIRHHCVHLDCFDSWLYHFDYIKVSNEFYPFLTQGLLSYMQYAALL